jgi:hypothetical protein
MASSVWLTHAMIGGRLVEVIDLELYPDAETPGEVHVRVLFLHSCGLPHECLLEVITVDEVM